MPSTGSRGPELKGGMEGPKDGQTDGQMDGWTEIWSELPCVESRIINPFGAAAQKAECKPGKSDEGRK